MKIKDFPPFTNLRGVKIKTPEGDEMYWYSQWQKGVWLKKSMDDDKVIPYTMINVREALNWEVIDSK